MNSGGLDYGLMFLSILMFGIPSWRYYWSDNFWIYMNKNIKLKPKYNPVSWLLLIVLIQVFLTFMLEITSVDANVKKIIISMYLGLGIAFVPRKDLTEGGIIGLFINRVKK